MKWTDKQGVVAMAVVGVVALEQALMTPLIL
jgi:hypothetical protein